MDGLLLQAFLRRRSGRRFKQHPQSENAIAKVCGRKPLAQRKILRGRLIFGQ